MSPLASYQQLFRLTGPAYVVVAFLGRLPLAMSQLGTLLLVAGSTGSYASGGISAGSLALANAVGAPISGTLADRFGQRRVVLAQSLAGASGLIALVGLSELGAHWLWIAAAAGFTGLVLPQVGPLARVRWRPITRGAGDGIESRRLVDTAFSYEGAADEASFVLGPALVGVAAALVNPVAALVSAAALLAVFGTSFALHTTASLVEGHGRSRAQGQARLLTGPLAALAGAQLVIGVVFGSLQTGTTVMARAAGELGAAGLLQALLGVGSVVAGLAVTVIPARFPYESRLVVFGAGLALLSGPLLLVDSLGSLSVALLVLGIAVAPYMITVFTLAERIVAPDRTASAMTMLAGITGLGYAVGSSVAGSLADASGHRAAFAVTVVAGVVAVVLTAAARPALAREASRDRVVDQLSRL